MKPRTDEEPTTHVRPSPNGKCLLLIDVFSHFRFKEGDALARAQVAMAPAMAATASACRRLEVPVIYCNDNFGRWTDTWQGVLQYVARTGPAEAKHLVERLHPQPLDIVLLKSRHSAFYQTQLAPLLSDLHVSRLAMGGAAVDVCVLCTAIDAHVRGFKVAVLRDMAAAATEQRATRTFEHMRDSLTFRVCSSEEWLEGA